MKHLRRHNGMVGKYIGNKLYVHKNYADKVIPAWLFNKTKKVIGNFPYNCVMWNAETNDIRFDSASDFDTAREPHVGNYVSVDCFGNKKYGFSNSIWHHKWMWVKDDYDGFDLKQSKAWSDYWRRHFYRPAKGTDASFNKQLMANGLREYIL